MITRLPPLIAFSLFAVALSSMAEGSAPQIRIENVRRAFHNGEHNAFTDLIRWRDKFWLTFRSSRDGHMNFTSGSVIVLVSDDAKSWRQVQRFSVPNRDTRDPHFLIFKDKLFVYSGTALVPADKSGRTDWNSHFGYATWTENGVDWASPRSLEGTYGHYIWRAAAVDGKAYLCARRWRDQVHVPGRNRPAMEAALLESEDGLVWRFHSLLQETEGNETAFIFEPDGTLVGVSRATREWSVALRSHPPYREWKRQTIQEYLGGPVLIRWDDRLLVGARRLTGEIPRTTLWWLEDSRLIHAAELPSDGDNSYPGIVLLDRQRALISWYSSHERDADGKPITAIYLADLVRTK